MTLAYRIMYRLGVTPWEHSDPPEPLRTLVEGRPEALPPGDMLDIGCGTGGDAIYCARHGWTVTGLDAVPTAVEQARRKAAAAGVNVQFLHADISRISEADIGTGFTLLLDGGCIHGLTPEQRRRTAAAVTAVAKPGATLLMFAFSPGHRGPIPHGVDPAEIPVLFSDWDLAFSRPASEITLRGPVRNARPSWYQLVKR